MGFFKPAEVADVCINAGIGKSQLKISKMIVLGILAGAFIAFGAESSNMAAHNLLADPATFGLGRVLCGAVFTVGLMMVVICGGELFTGNVLMIMPLAEKKIKLSGMLKNWVFVYIGNFIGAVLVAWLMSQTGLFGSSAGLLGAITLKIGAGKAALAFWPAFVLGIFCNWLVCLAVWMAFSAKDIVGKIFGIFFPIMAFVTSGFEHSIANMYYIPAAIFAKANADFVELSGVAPEVLDQLTWSGFFVHNLLPVTLGNIVGGGLFVAMAYWYAFKK